MPSKSIWLENSESKYSKLSNFETADVVIVGGGLSGLTTAYLLVKSGVNVVVLEAGTIGQGASGHTTAHITSQHSIKYTKLIRKHGLETAALYASANEAAIAKIAQIISDESIECDFQRTDSYIFTDIESKSQKIEDETNAAKKCGINAEYLNNPDFILPCKAAVKFTGQANFHPIKYINALAAAIVAGGGRIFEESRVMGFSDKTALTAEGAVHGKYIVIATHYPIIDFPGMYFARIMQSRAYVASVSGAPKVDGMWLKPGNDGFSYRMWKNNLIICGCDHKCGKQGNTRHYEQLYQHIAEFATNASVDNIWSAQDGITSDNLPYIGRYSKKAPYMFVATGFAKWGMTQATVAGMVISDLIMGIENRCSNVFSPLRKNTLCSIAGLTAQNTATAVNYISGMPRFGPPLCSHMKCRLIWNIDEKSWDCPCHGSRFDRDGKVIETPARECIDVPNKYN